MLTQLIGAIRNADLMTVIGVVMSAAILLLLCNPVHEFAHAYAAHKLGDDTANYAGRMTLNPMAHFDLIGAALILCCGVGYAKPVPVNMRNFEKPKRDMALTALAGPLSNLIMANIFALLAQGMTYIRIYDETVFAVMNVVYMGFYLAATININLAVFNLIPIPQFDGSRILGLILPDRIYYKIMRYERIIFYVFLVILVFGFLDGPLSVLMGFFGDLLFKVANLPFQLIFG